MPLAWSKTVGEISHYAHVAEDGAVVCGEACDDPHGVNSETRCTRQAWHARDADGSRCRAIIRAAFGDEVVAQIDDA